jgi:hypothetical protein
MLLKLALVWLTQSKLMFSLCYCGIFSVRGLVRLIYLELDVCA